MGFICLYVLIQKSGQKTAKSHLCAVEKNRHFFALAIALGVIAESQVITCQIQLS